MKKTLTLLAATLSLFACNPDDQPTPGSNTNNPTPPADPTVMYSSFTYTMNGQTHTRVQTKRNYTDIAYDIRDSFDRILNIATTEGDGPDFSARFSVPILRSGTQVFDTMNMTRPIKGNGNYTTHLAMNCSVSATDTTFFPNQDDDDPRPGHTVTYTSLQVIGSITDSIYIRKGPYTSHYAYGTWDVWQATGTFTDTVRGAVQAPGEPDGILMMTTKEYPITGSFTVRFLKIQ